MILVMQAMLLLPDIRKLVDMGNYASHGILRDKLCELNQWLLNFFVPKASCGAVKDIVFLSNDIVQSDHFISQGNVLPSLYCIWWYGSIWGRGEPLGCLTSSCPS